MTDELSWPYASVVVPLRNEVSTIGRCLDALLAQDYPEDRYEIVVADGESIDGSRDAVRLREKEQTNVRLVSNPERVTPFAYNAGIRAARGDVIVILGAHTFVEKDFLRESVLALQRTGADVAGGVWNIVGDGGFGDVVAEAVTSRFGVGQIAYRMATSEGYVDTAVHGAYRREVFERIGLFDEELVRDQDDELNHRLRARGGRIFVTPRVRMTYTPRSSLTRLWKQYWGYGYYKVRVFQKHPRMMRPRHFVPAASVAAGAVGVVGAALNPKVRWIPASLAGLYALGVGAASVQGGRRIGWSRVPALAATFPVLHFSYGTGFLVGFMRFVHRWWIAEPEPPVLGPRPE